MQAIIDINTLNETTRNKLREYIDELTDIELTAQYDDFDKYGYNSQIAVLQNLFGNVEIPNSYYFL